MTSTTETLYTTNESDYEEFSKSWKERQINVIQQTIGQLQHLDAAFGESYSILSELTYSAEGTFLIS
jgi:hypothetical protein